MCVVLVWSVIRGASDQVRSRDAPLPYRGDSSQISLRPANEKIGKTLKNQ
jgi:hypothetical protein